MAPLVITVVTCAVACHAGKVALVSRAVAKTALQAHRMGGAQSNGYQREAYQAKNDCFFHLVYFGSSFLRGAYLRTLLTQAPSPFSFPDIFRPVCPCKTKTRPLWAWSIKATLGMLMASSMASPQKPFPSLGRNIERLRSELGLTQERLAEMVDVHPRYLQKLEAGEGYPSLVVLSHLRTSLNCDWNTLLQDVT